MQLDYPELDQLKDIAFDANELKEILACSSCTGELRCPRCNQRMTAFDCRTNYDLELLDPCSEGHSFWLDAGMPWQVPLSFTG